MAKVQFNCRLDATAAKWIRDEARKQSKRAGKLISQADIVTMLITRMAFDRSQRGCSGAPTAAKARRGK